MLEDERIYQMHGKGGKKRAKHRWHYICSQLAEHEFVPCDPVPDFHPHTVVSFLVATQYVALLAENKRKENVATEASEAEAEDTACLHGSWP